MPRKKRRSKSRKRSKRRRPRGRDADRDPALGAEPTSWEETAPVFEPLDLNDLEGSAGHQLESVKAELAEVLAPFNAFDIVTNLAISNTPLNPDTYKETEFEGLSAGVELAAALLLDRGREGSGDDSPPIDATVLNRINDLVRQALSLMSFRRIGKLKSEAEEGDDADDAMGGLRHSILGRELYLRNPAFADQETRTIKGIFMRDPVAQALREVVGFTAEEALTLLDRIVERAGELLVSESARLHKDVEVVCDFYRQWRTDSDQVPEDLVPLFEAIGHAPDKVARRRIIETGIIGFWAQVGDVLSFTAAALAEEASLPLTTVQSFLDWYSVGFHDVDSSDWEAAGQVIRRRPLLRDGDEFLLSVHGNLLWSIRPGLEEALKPTANASSTSRHWNRFERARKSFVEDLAVDLLEKAINPTATYRNLEYRRGEEWYEADGLLVVDTFAIVVEAKGGALTPPTKRGAPERMKRDLSKLLDEGAAQAERLRTLVEGSEELTIRQDGTETSVDVKSIRHVFPVVVTLEDLGPFSIALWDLQRAGIIAADRHLPWAVSIHDLEIITDLVELPAQLLHYVIRRNTLNILERFHAIDELDLWMYYLDTGLYEEQTFSGPDAPDMVTLASWTDDLDAYYLWKSGARTRKAKKPVQKMHNQFRRILDHLEVERPHGFLEASIALLNMAERERRLVASKLKSMKKDSSRRGRFGDMTLQYTGSLGSGDVRYGMTWMTGPADQLDELGERLDIYCQAKKYQLHADTWVGFAAVNGQPGPFQYFVFGSFPWEPDTELDWVVDTMALADPEPEEE